MKRIIIVANGKLSKSLLNDLQKDDVIIGVDRGAYWLIANNIIPDVAIGDFDSVSANDLRIIKQKAKRIEEYPKNKDAADMELAIDHAIILQPKEVVIYGAIGSRLDHTMGNVHLLEKLSEAGIEGVIRDLNNEVRIVSGRTTVKKEAHYRYVSLLPFSETVEITLTGFLYDVSHTLIRRGQTLGISNEVREDTATIEVYRGKVLVMRSRD